MLQNSETNEMLKQLTYAPDRKCYHEGGTLVVVHSTGTIELLDQTHDKHHAEGIRGFRRYVVRKTDSVVHYLKIKNFIVLP